MSKIGNEKLAHDLIFRSHTLILRRTSRLSLGSAWLFLIAAEAIAAQEGLGYRIFLVRRYLSMDIILPYVVWIATLAFMLDFILRKISVRSFPWFHSQADQNS